MSVSPIRKKCFSEVLKRFDGVVYENEEDKFRVTKRDVYTQRNLLFSFLVELIDAG